MNHQHMRVDNSIFVSEPRFWSLLRFSCFSKRICILDSTEQFIYPIHHFYLHQPPCSGQNSHNRSYCQQSFGLKWRKLTIDFCHGQYPEVKARSHEFIIWTQIKIHSLKYRLISLSSFTATFSPLKLLDGSWILIAASHFIFSKTCTSFSEIKPVWK